MKTILLSSALGVLFLLGACVRKCYEPMGNCALTPDPGTCEALIPKYYFDAEKGKCREFMWGGCDGVVPFNTLEECEACLEEGR